MLGAHWGQVAQRHAAFHPPLRVPRRPRKSVESTAALIPGVRAKCGRTQGQSSTPEPVVLPFDVGGKSER